MSSLEARALAAFDAYVDLDSGHRAKALALLRTSDPELHAEVVRLLDADALRGPLLRSPQEILSGYEEPASERPDDAIADPRIGSLLGSWRVEDVIGSGGMGTVYRASRADGQYSQVVALKCVGTEVESPVLAEAIRNERSTLALLEHPNIATLLDGGIDGDGYPWFAMQLVQGEPIDRWCDRRRLGIRERIELFIQLCEGLAYAHGKDALHSDIKPSNILVDEAGRPMLLDFGLSSLTTRGGEAQRPQIAMTPGYTAPEVPSDGYSVRTDVYALGMVLYRLLCGALPSRGVTPGMVLQAPRPPSQLALQAPAETSQARGLATPAALSHVLAGDLDLIAMTCVDPDPDKRYVSVARLQADLRAWLQDKPVSVRGDDHGYRLRLFLRRRRVAAVATAVGLLCLAVGLGVAYNLQRQATQHAETARAMRMLFEDSFDILTVGSLSRSPLMSRDMLNGAEGKLRERSADATPEVRIYGLLALAKSHAAFGNYRKALDLVGEAQSLATERTDQMVMVRATQAHLLNVQARYAQALDASEQGLEQIESVAAADRDLVRLNLDVEMARSLRGRGKIQAAQTILDRALAQAEAMAPSDPTPLAELLIMRGEWSALFLRFEDAKRDYERAIALTSGHDQIVADNARAALARNFSSMDQADQALPIAEKLLASRRRLFGENHPETGKAWVLLANAQFWARQVAPAPESAQRGVAILRAALGDDHPAVAEAMEEVAAVYSQTGRSFDQAIASARHGLAILQRAHGPSHPKTIGAMTHLAATLAVRADAQPDAKASWQEVISLFSRAVEMGRRQGMPMLKPRVSLIKARLRIDQIGEETERELEQVISEYGNARGTLNARVLDARFVLAELYLRQGRQDQAQSTLENLLRDAENAKSNLTIGGILSNCHHALGDIALENRQLPAAREHFRQARAFALGVAGPEHPNVKALDAKLAGLDARTVAEAKTPAR